jgi:excisionase family DNA binding protein
MPIEINGQLLYSTTETCVRVGISRATLSRWIQKGVLNKIRRDRRGWRLFTENDLSVIIAETERITVEEKPRPK